MSIGHFRGIIPDGLVAAANFLNPRHKYKEARKYRKRYYVPVRHLNRLFIQETKNKKHAPAPSIAPSNTGATVFKLGALMHT